MKVDIKGKLKKWHGSVETKLRFGNNQGSSVTLIRFNKRYSFRRPLNELARGLPRAMEAENLNEVPVEVPDAMLANFEQTSPLQQSVMLSDQQSITAAAVAQESIEAPASCPLLRALRKSEPKDPESAGTSTSQDPNYCSWDDFARASGLVPLSSPPTSLQGRDNTMLGLLRRGRPRWGGGLT